ADAYGFTVARFYAAAGLLVICLLLLVTLYAVMRRLALPWLLSRATYVTLLSLSLLSLVDVEATVTRVNLAHGHDVDVPYLASLST
ncbi:DUF4153 domain-containing protein, partial [Acinetobacter baumannii]